MLCDRKLLPEDDSFSVLWFFLMYSVMCNPKYGSVGQFLFSFGFIFSPCVGGFVLFILFFISLIMVS